MHFISDGLVDKVITVGLSAEQQYIYFFRADSELHPLINGLHYADKAIRTYGGRYAIAVEVNPRTKIGMTTKPNEFKSPSPVNELLALYFYERNHAEEFIQSHSDICDSNVALVPIDRVDQLTRFVLEAGRKKVPAEAYKVTLRR